MNVPISRTGKDKLDVMKAASIIPVASIKTHVKCRPFQALAKRLLSISGRLTSFGSKSFRKPQLKLCLERRNHIA